MLMSRESVTYVGLIGYAKIRELSKLYQPEATMKYKPGRQVKLGGAENNKAYERRIQTYINT